MDINLFKWYYFLLSLFYWSGPDQDNVFFIIIACGVECEFIFVIKGEVKYGQIWFYVFIESIITILSLAVFFHHKIWCLLPYDLHLLTTWLILICASWFFSFCLRTNYGRFYFYFKHLFEIHSYLIISLPKPCKN